MNSEDIEKEYDDIKSQDPSTLDGKQVNEPVPITIHHKLTEWESERISLIIKHFNLTGKFPKDTIITPTKENP